MSVAIVVPVFRNAATLDALHRRLAVALAGEAWRLRLVIDACPDGSGRRADAIARADPRVRVTHLSRNRGQHGALVAGLRAEPAADAYVLLDADLQDPPEAIPGLLTALRGDDRPAGVFAGRRGAYESRGRRLTGDAHRRALRALTGLPADAGAYLALDRRLRSAVLTLVADSRAPSVVAAAGASGLPLTSVPVARARRPQGRSAWTARMRAMQAGRTLGWALAIRLGLPRSTDASAR